MLDLTRRRFLTGLVAAPIVITTPGLLMPVKAIKADFYCFDGVVDFGPPETHVITEAEFRSIHRTNNPAVIFLDIMNEQDKSIGGRIDFELLGTAADYCGEVVPA
jgi:hypothetical protein